MGLTSESTGRNALNGSPDTIKRSSDERVIALAGNPNVGKSTVFNALTGMNQHTGNWTGKTVSSAFGRFSTDENRYVLVDIPGMYSLIPDSPEESVARDFLCFGGTDMVVVVCDATCIERNLNLVLEILEITDNCVVCVNLIDEAKRKGVTLNPDIISERLGVPVISTIAQKKSTLNALTEAIDNAVSSDRGEALKVSYSEPIEEAVEFISDVVTSLFDIPLPARWLSLQLLRNDEEFIKSVDCRFRTNLYENRDIYIALCEAWRLLNSAGITPENLGEHIVSTTLKKAEEICDGAVHYNFSRYSPRDRKIDRIVTGKTLGYPLMILLLLTVFWITITGANYPSEWLSSVLFSFGDMLGGALSYIGATDWVIGVFIDGAYRVLAWVVSVMLPPMAIFFPLFTLLEDSGYLPRIAYNLDRPFKCCNACGKQALTLCMGFGCNAAGVTGCRIINSPRERLIAILTNNFVPCNGRFPTIITIIGIFFIGAAGGFLESLGAAAILTVVILFGIAMTFLVSKLLSKTLLKGLPSSFTLELPPYRKPQLGKVIIRSVFDRTLFVLGRAVISAAPAGIIIWILANVTVGDITLLRYITDFLDPLGRFLGLDGAILTGFILGIPANEIVLPIILMIYMSGGTLVEIGSAESLGAVLSANGWNWVTAVCVIIFSLMHWPCATTLMTIKKETGSIKWTIAAFLIPTVIGMILCALFSFLVNLFI